MTSLNASSYPRGISQNTFTYDSNAYDLVSTNSYQPTILFTNNNSGVVHSSSNRVGSYTTIGNIVFFNLRVGLTNKGSASGNAFITVPFAPREDTGVNVYFHSAIGGSVSAGRISGEMEKGINRINLFLKRADSGNPIPLDADTHIQNTTQFRITGTYVKI
jgi:hypothetical protein